MLNKYFFIGVLCFFAITSSNAESPTYKKETSNYAQFSPECLHPILNPILKSGDGFEGATWNDPSIIADRDEFVMYASADHNFDQKIEIYRWTSNDAINWKLNPPNPVLSPTKGAWDARSVETPSVIKFKDKYYMFYTGYKKSFADVKGYKIGYAKSNDGIHWTKIKNPLVKPGSPNSFFPNFNFDQYITAEPGAVTFNNQIFLYFAATGGDKETNSILETIGVITSLDGENWSQPSQAIKPPQEKFPRNKNLKGFSTPAAAIIDNKVHVFATLVSETPYNHISLIHAVSFDGISDWKFSDRFFDQNDFSWTKLSIRSPSALQTGKSVNFWFAGHASEQALGIGYAKCKLQ